MLHLKLLGVMLKCKNNHDRRKFVECSYCSVISESCFKALYCLPELIDVFFPDLPPGRCQEGVERLKRRVCTGENPTNPASSLNSP